MDRLAGDIRIALRSLVRLPGTTVLAAVALALGIGLTTTMFCIVDGVFLRGLPFERADRLLYVGELDLRRPNPRPDQVPINDYLEWRTTQQSFEALTAFSEYGVDVAADGVAAKRYDALRITPNMFAVLRVAPAMGRGLTDADAADGALPVVVISDAVWRRQFNGDPAIVGRVVRVSRAAATVVGVMPPGFGFPHSEHVWTPLDTRRTSVRASGASVHVFGRLRAGVGAGAAAAEIRALTERMAARDAVANLSAVTVPLLDRFISRQVPVLLTLMFWAVFGVLLIACVNVTNLLLARAADRVHEVGIRLAMGASRARVIRQFLIEGAMLAAAGAAAGIGIAFGGVRFFNATVADNSPPFWVDVRVDTRVLLFTAALAVAAALVSSLAPALRASRIGISGVLKDAARSTASLRMVRFSRVLVVVQVTLSFALLIVSGLLAKSVVAVTRTELPFRSDVLYARFSLPEKPYADLDSVSRAADRLLALVASGAGVSGAAVTTALPENAGVEAVTAAGTTPDPDVKRRPRWRRMAVSADFFRVMDIRIVRGRAFEARDRAGQPLVAVVTADLAQRLFPGSDPVGGRIQLGSDPAAPWRTVVGVVPPLPVANMRNVTAPPDAVFVPIAQAPARSMALLVSAGGDGAAALEAARGAMRELDPDLPLSDPTTLAALYHDRSWPIRLFGTIFSSFGLAALLLSAAGLYGVMAFRVRSRTQEIGVRMALGAAPSDIVWMVLRQGTMLLAGGMSLGLGIGGVLGQQMKELMFTVSPWDAGVIGIIAAVLAGAGIAATLIPARRAASIDPMAALRTQ